MTTSHQRLPADHTRSGTHSSTHPPTNTDTHARTRGEARTRTTHSPLSADAGRPGRVYYTWEAADTGGVYLDECVWLCRVPGCRGGGRSFPQQCTPAIPRPHCREPMDPHSCDWDTPRKRACLRSDAARESPVMARRGPPTPHSPRCGRAPQMTRPRRHLRCLPQATRTRPKPPRRHSG